jgi:predicted secreted protein
MNNIMVQLVDKLKDERSKNVIFVSHCILNENARYLGGAFNKANVPELLKEITEKDYGIIQMKCPEQIAWGGILKKYMWMSFSSKNSMIYHFRKLILPIFLTMTKKRYHKISKEVVKSIEDYLKSGFNVVGVIGIDGSPTCGVNFCLDMEKSFEMMASLSIATLERNTMNEKMYRECQSPCSGLFIKELKRILDKKQISIKFFAHNLISEMNKDVDSKIIK